MDWGILLAATGTAVAFIAFLDRLLVRRRRGRGVFVAVLRPMLAEIREKLDVYGVHLGFKDAQIVLGELLITLQQIDDLRSGLHDRILRRQLGEIDSHIHEAARLAPPGIHQYDEYGNQLPEGPEWKPYRDRLKELSAKSSEICTAALRRVSEIEAEAGPTRRRLLLIALTLLVGLVIGDWFLRNVEMARLVDAVEDSEQAMEAGGERLASINGTFSARLNRVRTATDFDISLQCFEGVCLSRAEAQEEIRRRWVRELEAAAADAAETVIDTGAGVNEVVVLPWHRAIRVARGHYLAHSEAWEDFFIAVSRDGTAVSGERPQIGATFSISGRAFRKATPPLPLYNLRQRIDQIW